MRIDFGTDTDADTFRNAFEWLSGYGVRVEATNGPVFDAYVSEVGPGARWAFALRQADEAGEAWGPVFEVDLDDIATLTVY